MVLSSISIGLLINITALTFLCGVMVGIFVGFFLRR